MDKEQRLKEKKSIYNIVYIFLGLFLLVIGYYVYFMVFKSNKIINSTYNRRQEVLAKRVTRGKILAADGSVLAETTYDDFGREVRSYPYDELFAHVVGRYAKAVSGLEETENIRLLSSSINSVDRAYNELVGEKSPGDNVITTLIPKLQQVAYDALGDRRGAVVAMEPSTGRILALVSKPDFNPNEVEQLWDELIADKDGKAPFLNRATQGLYPPGSTFKVLTSLEFMRENPSYKEYEFDCDSDIEYQGMVIHCNKNRAHGKVDLIRSFQKSCNTSYANIGKELDLDRFHALCNDFLFNSYLPISLANSPGSFTLQKVGSSVKEAMQTAIGQGNTLITPMQNAMIAATIANKGTMMKPYVVSAIENANGSQVKEYSPQVYSTPMSEEEADYLAKMMRKVVTDGTAKDLKELGVKAAGKTGSADNNQGKAHSWFIGYAPYDNPQIVVSIVVENAGTGSEYAVPIAGQLFDAYFN